MIYRNVGAALPLRSRGPKEVLLPRGETSIADAIAQQKYQLTRFREELFTGLALEMEKVYPGHIAGRILACGGALAAANTLRAYYRSQAALDALAAPGAVMMDESPEQTLAGLYALLGPRVVLLPIPLGKKAPKDPGWQRVTFEQTQRPLYQRRLLEAIKRGGNIGVLLGPASARLIALDIDIDAKVDEQLQTHPWLAKTLRTRGRRGCQFWLRLEEGVDYPNTVAVMTLKEPDGTKFGELRIGGGGGAQSIVYGVHPEGNRYEILSIYQPTEIALADLDDLGWRELQPDQPPEKDPGAEPEREPRLLRGASILQFSKRAIDPSKTLLGNRWLSRCCGGFVVAPSGHGKSTLVIQAAILWSCGRVAFGIKPAQPLRILIIQAEDDDNDIIEMAQMCDRLPLTEEERMLLNFNTHVEWVNDVMGAKFFPVLDDFLSQFRADLVIINPYTAYQGGDIRDDELNNDFLRVQLSAAMNKYNCGVLAVHHSPKTQFQKTEDFSWHDWMYSMAGGSALTNWARAVLVIAPTDLPGTYRFIAAKRFEKIGWQEREYWFAHSVENGKVLWVPATQDQIATAKTTQRHDTPEDVLGLIPVLSPLLQEKLFFEAKKSLHIGKNCVRDLVKILIHEGKVFEHIIPREGARSAKGYAKHPPVEEAVR
jgi:AAA domain/Bifunctional DNA primase/polymerase, N-terminal